MKWLNYFLILTLSFLIYSCDSTNPKPPDTKPPGYQEDIPWPSLADSPWPVYGADAQNTKRSKSSGPVNGNLINQIDSFAIGSGLAISDEGNLVFISGRQSALINLSSSGIVNWIYKIKKLTGGFPPAPAVLNNGDIIFAGGDSVLIKISKTGEFIWESDKLFEEPYSVSVNNDGNIIVLNGPRTINYINGADGKLKWQRDINEINSGEASTLAFSPDGTKIYLQGYGLTFVAISAVDGEELFKINDGIAVSAPSVDCNGNVFILNVKDNICDLRKYSAEGELVWSFPTNEDFCEGLSIDRNGNIVFGGAKIYSFSFDGKINWEYDLGVDQLINSPIIDKNSVINVFTVNGRFIQIEQNGKIMISKTMQAKPRNGQWNSYIGEQAYYFVSDGYILNEIN